MQAQQVTDLIPGPDLEETAPARSTWCRTLAKKTLPTGLQNAIRLAIAAISGARIFAGDYLRFLAHSGIANQDSEETLRARITAGYHVVEKGLSHYEPRPGFGKETAIALADSLKRYRRAGYRRDCSQYQSGVAVLRCYRQFQERAGATVTPEVEQVLTDAAHEPHQACGGSREIQGETLLADWRADFRCLAKSRHSIRHFSQEPVSIDAVLRAIDLARSAPSACNRQPVRVHVLRKRNEIEDILEIQGGARGFIQLIDLLLIITADMRSYFGCAERALGFVDGGLFAMTLIYALCYEGIGSCPLHTALQPWQEGRIRRIAGLGDPEALVVMLGVGRVPDKLKVAYSHRKPLQEYVVLH